MNYSIGESLQVTIVAMGLVFIVLTGLMCLMVISQKVIGAMVKKEQHEELSIPQYQSAAASVTNDPKMEKVAMIAAMIEAAENEPGKHFVITEVKRIK